MLLPKKISGPRKIILLIVVVILIGVIGYLVYDNFLSQNLAIIQPLPVEVEILAVPTIEPKFETDFLSQEPYRSFEENGQLPVRVENLGRPNPFRALPFSILEQ